MGKDFTAERLTQDLNLTPEQQTKVQPMIDQAKPQIAAIRREAMQKTKAVMDTMTQIRPLLTPDQQKKLDENIQKGSSRRHDSSIREDSGESDE